MKSVSSRVVGKRGFPDCASGLMMREGERRVREATRRDSVFFAGIRSCSAAAAAPPSATEGPWREMRRDLA